MNWTADFPILAADENGNRLVYLDSAATTQHPMQVLNAVVDYYTKENANPHRGVYELAMRATDAHEGARHTVAQFFNAEDDEIVFTQNTTESLNLVAYSYGMNFLHEGDEIVISVAEHHSNMVPWQRVAKATGAKLVYMYPGENGRLTTEELDKKITSKTKLVAIGMVSNVLGLRAPVEEIVARAHAVGAVVVLDCAQSAPHTPVDVKKLDVLPSSINLVGAETELLEIEDGQRRLKAILEPLKPQYDFILIDCSPSLGLVTLNALVASDSVLIPVQCEYFALEGLGKLLNTIKMTKTKLNPGLEIEGFLLTMYDSRLRLANQVAGEVREHFGDLAFRTIIQRNIRLSEAPSFGKPALLYDASSTGSINYLNLAKEFIKKNKS